MEKLDRIKIDKYLLKELKNPPTWTEEEKKIIAWSICWDGCISLLKSKHKGASQGFRIRPNINVANMDIMLLQKLQNIFRMGTIRNGNEEDCYHLSIERFEECLYLLSKIYEFLPAKQEQAFHAMEFIKSRISHKKGTQLRHIYTPFEIECREKVHTLNQIRGRK
jgi:hypothetical protein